MRTGIPREVHDDLYAKSYKHGQRHAKSRNPVDQIATHELAEYEAAMVGKKVHRQPHQVQLCKHGQAERVAESVGTVVQEKKHEGPNATSRGVRNIAIELGVEVAPPFVGIEVIR